MLLDQCTAAVQCTSRLRCRFHYDTFTRTPLVLDCHHTLCQSCVEDLTRGDAAVCPECGRQTTGLSRGSGNLPTNYALLDLHLDDTEILRKTTTELLDDVGGMCPVCLETLAQKAPLVLGCGHTLCVECVYRIALHSDDNAVMCPECRQHTDLEGGGLRVNVALQDTLRDFVGAKHGMAPDGPSDASGPSSSSSPSPASG